MRQLDHFIEQARRGDRVQQARQLGDELAHGWVDPEIQLGREPHRPQQPDRILPKAHGRLADHAHAALLQILHPANEVQHGLPFGVVEQGVDREVPPLGVAVDCAVGVVAQDASLLGDRDVRAPGAGTVPAAKRRHLNHVAARPTHAPNESDGQ